MSRVPRAANRSLKDPPFRCESCLGFVSKTDHDRHLKLCRASSTCKFKKISKGEIPQLRPVQDPHYSQDLPIYPDFKDIPRQSFQDPDLPITEEDIRKLFSRPHIYYVQDPLPVYPDFIDNPYQSSKDQTIPPDIQIWAPAHAPLVKSYIEQQKDDARVLTPFHVMRHTEQRRLIAEGVALHVLHALEDIPWSYYDQRMENGLHLYTLRKKFFKTLAKFALHIFDEEDFVRALERPMTRKNARELCRHLDEIFGDNAEGVARSAMRELSDGTLDLKRFPFLLQQDVDLILGFYRRLYDQNLCGLFTSAEILVDSVLFESSSFKDYHVYQHYVQAVMDAMNEHVPLEEEQRMDLLMNAGEDYSVIRQALYFEAWRDFQLEDLKKLHLENYGPGKLESFIISFHDSLNSLAQMKAQSVNLSKTVTESLISDHVFGNFKKEVWEAVRAANFVRMRHGSRFITMRHLLDGLFQSRVAEKMIVFLTRTHPRTVPKKSHKWRQMTSIVKKHLDIRFQGTELIYGILRLSHDVATALGHREVLLEHLFLAIVFTGMSLTDWRLYLESRDVTIFLKELGTGCEMRSPEELPEKLFWCYFFDDKSSQMPLTPKHMLEFLDKEFRKNNFKPLECGQSSTEELIITVDTEDAIIGASQFSWEQYCHLYCQYLFTLYAEV